MFVTVLSCVAFIILTRLAFTRLVLYVAKYLLYRLLKIELTVRRYGYFFSFHDVTVSFPNGPLIDVAAIWLTSSYWNNSLRKAICICVTDVRVQYDIQVKPSTQKGSKSNSLLNNTAAFKIGSYKRCLQFIRHFGVHVDTASCILTSSYLPENVYIHTKLERLEVELDHDEQELLLKCCTSVENCVLKLLQKADSPCVIDASLSTAATVSISLGPTPKLGFEIAVSKPAVHITEDVFLFVSRLVGRIRADASSQRNTTEYSPEDLLGLQGETTVSPVSGTADANNVANGFASSTIFNCIHDSTFCIDNIEVTLSRTSVHRAISLYIQKAKLMTTAGKTEPVLESVLKINGVEGTIHKKRCIGLISLEVNLKASLPKGDVNMDVVVEEPSISYYEQELQYWSFKIAEFQQSINSHQTPASKRILAKPSPQRRKSAVLKTILATQSFSLTLNIKDLQAEAVLPNSDGFKARIVRTEFHMQYISKVGGTDHDSRLLVSQVACCSSKSPVTLSQLSHRSHHWHTIFYCSHLMLKSCKQLSKYDLNAEISDIQGEWSPDLADYIIQVVTTVEKYRMEAERDSIGAVKGAALNTSESLAQHSIFPNVKLAFLCKNINLFACNNHQVCLMVRIDTVKLDIDNMKASSTLLGSNLVYCQQAGTSIAICPSNKLQDSVSHVKALSVIVADLNTLEAEVKLQEEICFNWTTGFHACLWEAIQVGLNLRTQLLATQPPHRAASLSQRLPKLKVTVAAGVRVCLELSRNHKICLSTPGINISADSSNVSLHAAACTVTFDKESIFLAESLDLCLLREEPRVKSERLSLDSIILKKNTVLAISFNSLCIRFPYKFNFASYFEEVINTYKWLKILHKKRKVPFTVDSPLPPDVIIRAKTVRVQINDDPFEVKLGDNYALMVDEMNESERRKAAMDKKIEDLRAAHKLLSHEKIEELYQSLLMRNSEIYIQRSQKLYENSNVEERELFTWKLSDLEILALADVSLHGKENCVKHMRDIDSETPYPEEGMEFITLWCRMVSVRSKHWAILLRDYSFPAMEIKGLNVWGRFMGAEQIPHQRAKRTCVVEVPPPWKNVVVERSMPPLKFYHDFSADVTSFDVAYGACWEGAYAMFNLSTNLINRPSVDPSKPLPFFDKLRLLIHGRLTMSVGQMRWLYHASLDPYNSTEFMEWTWTQLALDWTNAKFILKGDLDINLRTASKYDDCCLMHFPNLRFSILLDWICKGNSYDHHAVMPCAPDKLPEYSLEKHEHDSYRAFRSQNVTLSMILETKRRHREEVPTCSFYSSSLRQLEKILMCIQHVTRPTKRGRHFNNTLPRKPILSRHYRFFKFSLRLHEFKVSYWMSKDHQRGFEVIGQALNLDNTMSLQILPIHDDLIHRPRADWSVKALSANLEKVQCYLCSTTEAQDSLQKTDFVFISRIIYRRMELSPPSAHSSDSDPNPYLHKLEVRDVRVLWTKHNRTVSFGIFEGYRKADALKRNLSAIALKGISSEAPKTPTLKPYHTEKFRSANLSAELGTPSPLTRMQTGDTFSLLNRLIEETDSNFVAYSEEETVKGGAEQLHGLSCCREDDITNHNWLIEAYNSQIRIHGPEAPGYMIISAAKAQVRSSEHEPVWHNHLLKSKTTWTVSVDCMQYYATAEPTQEGRGAWLSKDNIEDAEFFDPNLLEKMQGSGSSMGGIIHEQCGDQTVELQRIIPRCRCQLFYASYGEVDLTTVKEVPALPSVSGLMENHEGVDTFTLLHHDVSCCMNSLQYNLIMDIVNNLLLYIEPTKKEVTARLQRVRFRLQFSSDKDQKTPILVLQNRIREQFAQLRQMERQRYLIKKSLPLDEHAENGLHDLDAQIEEVKELISTSGEDLGILINCYNQMQIQKVAQLKAEKNETSVTLRRNEVCFVHASWRLTERDGQVGLSDMVLKNFVYTKTFNNDDSGCHQLEVGSVKVTSLQSGSPYKDVLTLEDKNLQRRVAVRLISRDRSPVGGISIKEHFEVNIVPLSIQLTKQFFNSMMQFFFQDDQSSGTETKKKKTTKRSFHGVDDIEKMKARAENNNMFIYIKIPEVPLRVSYKGLKDKNYITDLNDFLFQLPTLEYHNKTWRWMDLVVQIKADLKKVVVSQAIKQKLHMKSKFYVGGDSHTLTDSKHDEDKARMLLGDRGSSERSSQRKGLFGKSKLKK